MNGKEMMDLNLKVNSLTDVAKELNNAPESDVEHLRDLLLQEIDKQLAEIQKLLEKL